MLGERCIREYVRPKAMERDQREERIGREGRERRKREDVQRG